VGDVLLSRDEQVGDVGDLRRRVGLASMIARMLSNPNFLLAVASMAAAFFSLLFALSWGDVSLVAPAAASLTFIANAVAAKIFCMSGWIGGGGLRRVWWRRESRCWLGRWEFLARMEEWRLRCGFRLMRFEASFLQQNPDPAFREYALCSRSP